MRTCKFCNSDLTDYQTICGHCLQDVPEGAIKKCDIHNLEYFFSCPKCGDERDFQSSFAETRSEIWKGFNFEKYNNLGYYLNDANRFWKNNDAQEMAFQVIPFITLIISAVISILKHLNFFLVFLLLYFSIIFVFYTLPWIIRKKRLQNYEDDYNRRFESQKNAESTHRRRFKR